MQAITSYIRTEWKCWIATFVGVFAYCMLSAAVAAPIKYTAGGVTFIQDKSQNTWYARYGNRVSDLDLSFKDMKVMWQGRADNRPLFLIAGQGSPVCEMNYRLVYVKQNGQVVAYDGINQCKTKSFMVIPGYPFTKVFINDETKRFNLEIE